MFFQVSRHLPRPSPPSLLGLPLIRQLLRVEDLDHRLHHRLPGRCPHLLVLVPLHQVLGDGVPGVGADGGRGRRRPIHPLHHRPPPRPPPLQVLGACCAQPFKSAEHHQPKEQHLHQTETTSKIRRRYRKSETSVKLSARSYYTSSRGSFLNCSQFQSSDADILRSQGMAGARDNVEMCQTGSKKVAFAGDQV